MHPFYLRIFVFILFVVSCVYGIKLSQKGFNEIESFKKLERLVPTKILGVLAGENQVSGWASTLSENSYIRSPKTNTPSVYYRYLLEREERDSDGHTRWVTEKDESRSINFLIEDRTRKATVLSQESTDQIKWFLHKKYSKTSGRYRHSQ